MSVITRDNFKERFPEIKKSFEKCKFISVDLEFSALRPLHNQIPSLFDSSKERYSKLLKNLDKVIPVQVGLTAFHFDNKDCDYYAEVFTFYVLPAAFATVDKSYYFQASTVQFLAFHNFDFNKFAYSGIFYLNSLEEAELRQKQKNNELIGENSQMHIQLEHAVEKFSPLILKWYNKSKTGEFLGISEIYIKYKQSPELIYFLHKNFRSQFKNLWTYIETDTFYVKKVSTEEFENLTKTCKLDEEVIDCFKGFTHVFNLLTSLKKPIIGHNLLQDLMIMINNFEAPLPHIYSDYKRLTHELFPTIFDTKVLYYELRRSIPKEKLPEETSLQALFEYFKDGLGRHLVVDRTAIECDVKKDNFGNYHEAGWDSFCAGYIFVRMAFYNISSHYPQSKKFVPGELISGISQFKNCVNVIRGSTTHIKIDGEDPSTTRPPWLIVESIKNEPVDLTHLTSLLSSYGFVDVKKIRGDKVLVAVDTYRTAREISRILNVNNKFKVKQYNFLRHSPVVRTLFLTALTVSGTFLVWLTHTIAKSKR